jgi:hypothetical protein
MKTKLELSTYILKKTGVIRKTYNQYLFDDKSMEEVRLILQMEKTHTKKQLLEMVETIKTK